MDIKQAFAVLGIKANASIEEAKLAHRDLVAVWHPDKYAHNNRLQLKAQEQLKQINQAWDIVRPLLKAGANPAQNGDYDFDGFTSRDFSRLGSISPNTQDKNLEFKRELDVKVKSFIKLLHGDVTQYIKQNVPSKNNWYKTMPVKSEFPMVWSTIYFYDKSIKESVAFYPNINFEFHKDCLEFALNGETRHSFFQMYNSILEDQYRFQSIAKSVQDYNVVIWYKFQWLPKNHFIWEQLDGFPLSMYKISVSDLIEKRKANDKKWKNIRKDVIHKMETGSKRHPLGRRFNDTEINFAKGLTRQGVNSKPNYAIHIAKNYSAGDIVKLDKIGTITLFKKEISRLGDCLKFIFE